jgi:hypothetical protein
MLPLEGYPKELALSLSAITNIENKTALSEQIAYHHVLVAVAAKRIQQNIKRN